LGKQSRTEAVTPYSPAPVLQTTLWALHLAEISSPDQRDFTENVKTLQKHFQTAILQVRQEEIMKYLLPLFIIIITVLAPQRTQCGLRLHQPESVVYDSGAHRFLVSDAADGTILQLTPAGDTTVFARVFSSTRGLALAKGKLYAAGNEGIARFDLVTGKPDTLLRIPGAGFLNDILLVQSSLFVSDTRRNRIYRISEDSWKISVFVSRGISAPNGLAWDSEHDRLLLCSFRNAAPVQYISLADSSVGTLWKTELDQLDGIASLGNGLFAVSSWGSDAVYLFSSQQPPLRVAAGLRDPADICYIAHLKQLAVPWFNDGRVTFLNRDKLLEILRPETPQR